MNGGQRCDSDLMAVSIMELFPIKEFYWLFKSRILSASVKDGFALLMFFPAYFKICARQALECYMKETNVLAQENEGDDNITSTISKIQRNINAAWVSLSKMTLLEPGKVLRKGIVVCISATANVILCTEADRLQPVVISGSWRETC